MPWATNPGKRPFGGGRAEPVALTPAGATPDHPTRAAGSRAGSKGWRSTDEAAPSVISSAWQVDGILTTLLEDGYDRARIHAVENKTVVTDR